MLGFGALNAVVTDNDSSFSVFHEVRKEEQEAEALALYNKAIECHKNNNNKEAKEYFLEVLQTDLSTQAPEALSEGDELLQNAALFLKYNVFKQLADIFEVEDDKEKALDYLLEAAVIDESDVSLWWKVGQLATATLNVRLARYACEKGLIYSPNHWLCLDHLITVLYVIGDYQACLDMIAKALERDESYSKGFAIRDQIFKEEPHFKKSCISLLSLYMDNQNIDEKECQSYIEEALILRGKRKLLAKCDELPKVKLTKALQYYTWLNLVESLLQLYQELTDPKSQQSLCSSVDLNKYYKTDDQQATLVVPSPDILSKKYSKCSLKDSEFKSLKRKKILQSSQDSESQPKRRSTRVKLSKHKETDVNWSDLVYAYFPADFRSAVCMTDTEDSQDSQIDIKENQITKTYWGSPAEIRKESILVSKFINENMKNSGCMGMIENLMLTLSGIWNERWSSGLVAIYQPLYEKFRKHTCYPNIISADNDEKYMEKLGKVILMSLEFQLDHLAVKTSYGASPILSPYKGQSPIFETDAKLRFLSDLHYISILGAINKSLADSLLFKIRFYWVQGRYCMTQNEINMATNAFSNCSHLLSNYDFKEVILYNCQYENNISEEYIEKKLDSAQQSQSLDELQLMLNQGKHEELIGLLESALEDSYCKTNGIKVSPERPLQFLLLQESYFLSRNYKKCFECTGAALAEGLSSPSSTETWKLHFNKLLTTLNSCFTYKEAQDCVTDQLLQTYCDKLVKLIELSMDNDQGELDLTTLPWLITYRIMKLKHLAKNREIPEKMETSDIEGNPMDNSEEDVLTTENFSPLKFLKDAHEYLGRKHWCCHDNGLLLQEFVKEGLSQLNKVSKKDSEDIYRQIDQCFYCLYGNPCKKSKTKVIHEHNDKPILLTWQNANILFVFYKPDGLPELDLRTNTISVEVQNVLRKIVSVVPQHDIEVIPFETLQQYVDGGDSLNINLYAPKESTGLDDLFYYLGDFYFKNKEFSKALKFYMHDVCVKPTRFQSWAAMALIRGTRLEEKINQCDLKGDGTIRKHITATLRCYEKAVTLHNGKCLVLEEYGQTAYMLHSYAARKFYEVTQEEKQEHSTLDYYKTMQRDMLLLSEKCFADALNIATSKEGERWLHYYMLGKTAEKLGRPPNVYLDYYQKSLEELYHSGAHYLKKIPYHGPPEYSIEAVELFYRLHASMLKILNFSEEIDYDLIEEQLQKVTNQNIYQEAIEIDKASLKEYDKAASEGCNKTIEQNVTIKHECQQSTAATDRNSAYNGVIANDDDVDVVAVGEDKEDLRHIVSLLVNNLTKKVCEIIEGGQNTSCSPSGFQQPTVCVNLESSATPCMMEGDVDEDVRCCVEEIIERIHNEMKTGSDIHNVKFDASELIAEDCELIQKDNPQKLAQRRSDSIPPCGGELVKPSELSLFDVRLKPEKILKLSKQYPVKTYTVDDDPATSSEGKCCSPPKMAEEAECKQISSLHVSGDLLSLQVSCAKVAQNTQVSCEKLVQSTHISCEKLAQSTQVSCEKLAQSTQVSCEKLAQSTGLVVKQQHHADDNEKLLATNVDPSKDDSSSAKLDYEACYSATAMTPVIASNNGTETAVVTDEKIVSDVLTEIVEVVSLWTRNLNRNRKIIDKHENRKASVPLNVVSKDSDATRSDSFDLVSKIKRKTFKKCTFKDEDEERRHVILSNKCLNALGFCIRRFPEHYKSQYLMARFLANDQGCKNLQWSRDLLLGGSLSSKHPIPLPIRGLFSGKKKTNLFQYLWRIPVNEIDRAGSFCTHICRAVELLLNVLYELSDTNHLLHISTFLYKTPDKDKKYLRDNDRAFLAVKAFDLLLDILKRKTNSLSKEEELKSVLLDLYEAYKHSQKMQISQKGTEYYFIKSYKKLLRKQPTETDDHAVLLDDVIKFCQRIKPSA